MTRSRHHQCFVVPTHQHQLCRFSCIYACLCARVRLQILVALGVRTRTHTTNDSEICLDLFFVSQGQMTINLGQVHKTVTTVHPSSQRATDTLVHMNTEW